MTKDRPTNEPRALEALFGLVLIILALFALFGCCPKVTPQPPQIIDRWDTAFITLPPPPPIVLPADSTLIHIDLKNLCDSAWRAQNLLIRNSGQRIHSQVDISETTLRFTCKEDSLIHLLDSIRGIQINHHREEKQQIVVEKCPLGWRKWWHTAIPVASFILIVLCLIIAARSRR